MAAPRIARFLESCIVCEVRAMSGPDAKEHAEHLQQKATSLRHHAAGLANSVAATEEEAADTLEKVTEHRPAADAERLRAQAESARQYAAKERCLSNQLSNDRGRQQRTLADERGPRAAAQGGDAKA